MNTVGIIVEYNPLHSGHVYHFNEAKAISGAEAVVAVMSGNFLQRGEPALAGKWARAEMALEMGADLVIELPVAYSSQPAEWFAFGAVSALDATGVVSSLCFGSESGEISWLQETASLLHREPEAFSRLLRDQLKTGVSYPAAYASAAREFTGIPEAESIGQPNNSLGLHYLMALLRLNSTIRPLTIGRKKAGYHDREAADREIASATAIRLILTEKNSLQAIAPYIPSYTLDILTRERDAGRSPVTWESFARPLIHTLITRPAQELEALHEVTEGLESRLKQALSTLDYTRTDWVEQLLEAVKTKRYTRTKLQRTLLRILLNHPKTDLSRETLSQGVPYLRILGFSERGRELLKQMKKTARVPVITKVGQDNQELLKLDIAATAVYAEAFQSPSAWEMQRDFYQAPLRVNKTGR